MWHIIHIRGYSISHTYIAVTPGCPPERHPTRACSCKVFRTHKAAQTYVDQQ